MGSMGYHLNCPECFQLVKALGPGLGFKNFNLSSITNLSCWLVARWEGLLSIPFCHSKFIGILSNHLNHPYEPICSQVVCH